MGSLRAQNHMSLIFILIKKEALKLRQEGRNWPLGGHVHHNVHHNENSMCIIMKTLI